MREKTVFVGVLVLFVVAGIARTVTATSSLYGFSIDQTPGESVEILIVDTGTADSISLGAPNGNRSFVLTTDDALQSGTRVEVHAGRFDDLEPLETDVANLRGSDFNECRFVHGTTGEVTIDGQTVTFENSGGPSVLWSPRFWTGRRNNVPDR